MSTAHFLKASHNCASRTSHKSQHNNHHSLFTNWTDGDTVLHRLTQMTQESEACGADNVTCDACEAVVTNHGKQDRWQHPLICQGGRGVAYRS